MNLSLTLAVIGAVGCLVLSSAVGIDVSIITLSFNTCLGEDGRDFIAVEHCGDDFLAALAESMQDTEEWDDLQAIESEACGTLNNLFDKDVLNSNAVHNDDNGRSYINVEDSPKPRKHPNIMELDSSSDSEDLDFGIPKKKDVKSTPSCTDWSSPVFMEGSTKCSSKSLVCILAHKSLILILYCSCKEPTNCCASAVVAS